VHLRHQPPVHSPLSPRALAFAALAAAPGAPDPRAALRERLRRDFAADEVVLFASGTLALQAAVEEAQRRVGAAGGIALPAFGCYDLATAAVGARSRISLYDLDPATLAPDLADVERVLRAGARVLVVAPLCGIPVEWDDLETLARRFGAMLVEDAAQGHGARWGGRPLGSLGAISVLSFGRGKGWTGGGGGALLLRAAPASSAPSADRAASALSALVRAAAQWALGRPGLYGIPASIPTLGLGETRYHAPGAVRGISAVSAALAERTAEAASREASGRRTVARELSERIPATASLQPIRILAGADPGYLRLPLRLARGLSALPSPAAAARLGIARSYPTTLAELPAVRIRLRTANGHWRGAAELVRTLITIPTHSWLRPAERDALVAMLRSAALPDGRDGRAPRERDAADPLWI
jgi:dTDP-4-amino-4,6-dideoxygalactose transaminase